MNITLRDIDFAYDKTPVLKRINGEIKRGDFVALVGPNGSGKSTLIKCINGILRVLKGQILINGENIRSYHAGQLAGMMAYVPQMEQKRVPMRVFDAVLIGRKPHIKWRPARKDLEITAGILEKLQLQDVAMNEVQRLSGGQQQRVCIARALAQEPELLLLDEPTANLDLKHQMDVLELLCALTEQGMTVVMALHDINMASLHCTRALMMKNGSVFAGGGREIFTAENIGKLYDVKVRAVHKNGSVYFFPDLYPNPNKEENDV